MSKSKLNEIVAVANGKKSASEAALKSAYHVIQKEEMFTGVRRNYRALDESGEKLPSESKAVPLTIEKVVGDFSRVWTNMIDVVLTQETGNTVAKADVVINDTVILADMPVTTLIFLEKKLVDIHTFVSKLPELCTSENWARDENLGVWQSSESVTHRTKKAQKPIVLYDATPEHPAQTQLIAEDQLVGYWHTTKLSGCASPAVKASILARINALKEAVIRARERANSTEVDNVEAGAKLFKYIFG